MSNTPTESEFDKELDRALTNHRIWVYGVLSECNDKTLTQEELVRENAKYQAQAIKAIKQAVDRHVIGMDALSLAVSPPIRIGDIGREWTRVHDEYKKASIESGLQFRQRKALCGGDKK
ncbi:MULTISPECIES: hypothetical protein [Rhodococcus]|uniref:hypothetical protein n=1 Tax=Rhodococcus TaxID=1827 RepID=UPI00124895B9|nr:MULTISPECIES: hypothetical protein [Rhodococcus]MCJ0950350.1 hypothetical protein [Rhodococcus sp. ARC_M8]QEX10889.1 hypothetical protein F6X56_14775 [Rhodococcus erythropolis]UKO88902.1 hypothetical protein ITJ47_14290 [Rhodococcus erythropolis]BBE45487.1 hypothetical protein RE2895_24180 [Rhodococcus erythropolis]